MMRTVLFVCALLAIGLNGNVARAADRVVVVDVLQTTEKLRVEAGSAIQEALVEQRFEPVTANQPGEHTCDSPACFARLAKEEGGIYTLVVQGTAGATGYRISMDLREGATGRTLGSDSKECELCDAKDFRKAVRERTTILLTRVQQEKDLNEPKVAPGAQLNETTNHSEKGDVPLPDPDDVGRSFWQQPLPMMGVGLGLLGAGVVSVGAYYLAVDGQSTCQSGETGSCGYYQRDTGTFGWAMLGTGIAAMAGGTALAIWGRDSTSSVQVALSPQHVWVRGRF